MKYTLLEMVQTILSSMDSDQVTDIAATDEAKQIALILRDNYWQILTKANLPEHYNFFQLTQSGSTSRPTLMTIPSGIDNIQWVKYNKIATGETDASYREVNFKPMDLFMEDMYTLSEAATNVGSASYTVGSYTVKLLWQKDKAPTYYTTFDDNTILFDSFDATVDTQYLLTTKSLAYGLILPAWTVANSFIPTLDDNLFPLLINEAKSQAFAELKQTQNLNSEKKARSGWISQQQFKWKVTGATAPLDHLPNYSRVHRSGKAGQIPKNLKNGS